MKNVLKWSKSVMPFPRWEMYSLSARSIGSRRSLSWSDSGAFLSEWAEGPARPRQTTRHISTAHRFLSHPCLITRRQTFSHSAPEDFPPGGEGWGKQNVGSTTGGGRLFISSRDFPDNPPEARQRLVQRRGGDKKKREGERREKDGETHQNTS